MSTNEEKISGLRIKHPHLPKFYDKKGNVILCECGNVADTVAAAPGSHIIFSQQIRADCYDCMIPFGTHIML